MRGTLINVLQRLTTHTTRSARTVRLNWQPATVIAAVVVAVTGITVTVARLTCWLLPELGLAPAATVAGVLVTRLALAAGQARIQETDR
jgi:hypothetical protein